MDGFMHDSQSLPSCTTESRDMVSNGSNEGRGRSQSQKERQREIFNTSRNMGSTPEQDRINPEYSPMYPTPNVLMVDFNGFQLGEDVFIKELALYHPFAMTYWVGTFQPPFSKTYCKKKILDSIDYQTVNHHGISWDEGQYPYAMLPHFLNYCTTVTTLYTESPQKANDLQQLTQSPVCHLDFQDNLPLASYCSLHDATKCYCALDHAVRLGRCFAQMFSFKCL